MRILIIKLAAIGDVLRTTSILPGLKEKYHPVEIDWLTAEAGKEILLNNPVISHIYTWEERGSLGEYDLVVSLEDELEACALASRISSKQLIGSFASGGKIDYTPSAWFDMSAVSKDGLDKANELKKANRKTYQQHMADLLGINIGPYIFNLRPDEIEYGEKFIRDLGIEKHDKIVGVNTGAGRRWQLKALSIEKTIDLVNRLRKDLGVVSLILGGEEERERNEIVAKETGMPNGGIHSLRHFAAVVGQVRVLVSSDSLAMHFGIAMKRRLVAFFGPTSAAEIELYGLGEKIVPEMDCVVCYKKKCEIRPNCMDLLRVEKLFDAVKRQLVLL